MGFCAAGVPFLGTSASSDSLLFVGDVIVSLTATNSEAVAQQQVMMMFL